MKNFFNASQFKKYTAEIILFFLIFLTSLNAYLGEFSANGDTYDHLILIILVLKAQLIIDYFMHLKKCAFAWRYSMSAFAIVIACLIGFLN